MPDSIIREALKAQAVAAYTYYSYQRQAAREQPNENVMGADFFRRPAGGSPYLLLCGSTEGKMGGDAFDSTYEKYAQAVDAVLGKTDML